MPNIKNEACQEAREFIENYLSGKGISLSGAQVDRLVQECCDDPKSKDCLEAVAALVASEACDAYTQNACEPCCEFAAGIIAPYIAAAIWEAGKALGDAGSLLGAILDSIVGTSCSEYAYKPAADNMVGGYITAARKLTFAYETSFRDAMGELGIGEPAWRKPHHATMAGDRICAWDDPEYTHMVLWETLLVSKAAKLRRTSTGSDGIPIQQNAAGSLAITADSSYGAMTFPNVTTTAKNASQYFHFSWKHWTCNAHWAAKFETSARTGLQKRWLGIEDANTKIENELTAVVAKEAGDRKSRDWLATRIRFKLVEPDTGVSLFTVVAGLAAVGGLAYFFRGNILRLLK